MIAIIAEKPSLARNIVAGIGEMKKKQGYYENDQYIVTWAFGHLFSLCDVEDYAVDKPTTKKWSLDNLPCFPENFKFKLKTKADGSKADGIVNRVTEGSHANIHCIKDGKLYTAPLDNLILPGIARKNLIKGELRHLFLRQRFLLWLLWVYLQ